jgi:hypothetical protein
MPSGVVLCSNAAAGDISDSISADGVTSETEDSYPVQAAPIQLARASNSKATTYPGGLLYGMGTWAES